MLLAMVGGLPSVQKPETIAQAFTIMLRRRHLLRSPAIDSEAKQKISLGCSTRNALL